MVERREQLLEIMEDAAKGETKATLRARIAELEAEVERLTKEAAGYRDIAARKSSQVADMIRAEALSRTGAVKVSYANSTAPNRPFTPTPSEGQQEPAARAHELSWNTGELIDKMAEAIRGDTTSDDTPWATLSEDRKEGWRGDAERALAAIKDYLTPAPVVPAPEAQHTDDKAVDRFAAAMKRKLAQKREEGRGGWDDPEQCSAEYLSNLLRDHVEKGDPLDVGNLAMMLHQRGDRISPAPEAQQEPVAWQEPELTCPHIERAVMSGELSPAVVDELAAIREINSQLRYGTWALKAQLKAITRPSEQAVTDAMVEAACEAFGLHERKHGLNHRQAGMREALKAAMEAGR